MRYLIRLREQTVDDGLMPGRRRARKPPSTPAAYQRVSLLDDIVRGHEAPSLTREQCLGFSVAYAEERRRAADVCPVPHAKGVRGKRAECSQCGAAEERLMTSLITPITRAQVYAC